MFFVSTRFIYFGSLHTISHTHSVAHTHFVVMIFDSKSTHNYDSAGRRRRALEFMSKQHLQPPKKEELHMASFSEGDEIIDVI